MFNAFLYEKQALQSQQMEDLKNRFIKHETVHRTTQSKMSGNYRKRVENFVLQMADRPIVTHDFVAPLVNIRDEEPAKFLGPSSVILRSFKHEKDRIKENIENYKNSRMDYTTTPFEFRKRNQGKEIQPMMRFTSKTNFERVASRLKELMQHPNDLAKSLTKGENLSDSFIMELSKSPEATNKYLAKHVLPDLNQKTHFKATQSLFLALPDSLMDKAARAKIQSERASRKLKESEDVNTRLKSKPDLDLSDNQTRSSKGDKLPMIRQVTIALNDQDEKQSKEYGKQSNLETVNPADVSKKVLMKCNVIKNKKNGVKALPKGSGHLMSMSERNLKQIYQELYRKEIQSAGQREY